MREPPFAHGSIILDYLEPLGFWLFFRCLCIAAIFIASSVNIAPSRDSMSNESSAAHFRATSKDPQQFYAQAPREFHSEHLWVAPLLRWDSIWYLSIAEGGYVYDSDLKRAQNVAFFPLYPLAIIALAFVGVDSALGALLIANLCFILATCLMYLYVLSSDGRPAARWAVLFWLAFPYSLYGNVGYSESTMALVVILWLRYLLQQRWIAAGFLAGLASGLRPQGICLAFGFLKGLLSDTKWQAALGIFLAGSGLSLFMLFLYSKWGDPLLFVTVQKYWRPLDQGSYNPLDWLYLIVHRLWEISIALYHSNFSDLYGNVSFLLGLWTIAWLPAAWRRFGWAVVLVSSAMWSMSLTTGSLVSLGRFSWVILPLFIAAGIRLQQSPWRWVWLVVFVTGLLVRSAIYSIY